VGAHNAVNRDGRRLVFKWSEDPVRLADLARAADRVERLRGKGYPAPRYYAPMPFDGGVAIFQDAVDGAWSDDVDDGLVDAILALNDLQAGEADEPETWRDYIAWTLTEGANGYCLHDTLEDYSVETRGILGWVRDVGRSLGDLPAEDLVHLDFHHQNILRAGGRLSAVIDWEGCTPGDRAFDLVTFSFGFTHARAALGAEERLWRRVEEMASVDRLAAYVAHMSLRRLDWAIRHHAARDVDRLLAVVAERRRRLER